MPEDAVGLAVVHAPYSAYASPPLVPWFVSRRPYCDGRSAPTAPHGPRPSAGGAGKTFRSALRVFNVAEPMAQPMSCSPPPANSGAAYGCCEYRYASNNWAASRWRRAYTPAFATKSRDPQWRPSKYDDGRDGKSSSHPVDVDSSAGAVDHGRTNTENFLPRIIKPRKRKKKDRKPSGAEAQSSSSSASSVSSASSPQLPKKVDDASAYQKNGDAGRLHVSRSLLEGLRSAAAVAAAAALAVDQHGIDGRLAMLKSLRDFDGDSVAPTGADDAIALLAAMVDVDADDEETEAVFCNCRYCDPQGVVWDVKEKRYSANLMQPGALSASAYYGAAAPASESLLQPPASPIVDTRQPKKLQVSSQIVTSLNGHRDIEIKFYSSSSEKS